MLQRLGDASLGTSSRRDDGGSGAPYVEIAGKKGEKFRMPLLKFVGTTWVPLCFVGGGAYGKVFEYRDNASGNVYAVKMESAATPEETEHAIIKRLKVDYGQIPAKVYSHDTLDYYMHDLRGEWAKVRGFWSVQPLMRGNIVQYFHALIMQDRMPGDYVDKLAILVIELIRRQVVCLRKGNPNHVYSDLKGENILYTTTHREGVDYLHVSLGDLGSMMPIWDGRRHVYKLTYPCTTTGEQLMILSDAALAGVATGLVGLVRTARARIANMQFAVHYLLLCTRVREMRDEAPPMQQSISKAQARWLQLMDANTPWHGLVACVRLLQQELRTDLELGNIAARLVACIEELDSRGVVPPEEDPASLPGDDARGIFQHQHDLLVRRIDHMRIEGFDDNVVSTLERIISEAADEWARLLEQRSRWGAFFECATRLARSLSDDLDLSYNLGIVLLQCLHALKKDYIFADGEVAQNTGRAERAKAFIAKRFPSSSALPRLMATENDQRWPLRESVLVPGVEVPAIESTTTTTIKLCLVPHFVIAKGVR